MIENTLTAEEVGAALEAMQRLRTELIAAQAQASSEQLSGSIVSPAGGHEVAELHCQTDVTPNKTLNIETALHATHDLAHAQRRKAKWVLKLCAEALCL